MSEEPTGAASQRQSGPAGQPPSRPEQAAPAVRHGQDLQPEQNVQQEPVPGAEALRAELERMEDRYKRALADLENYRKRSTRELERRIGEAQEALLRDWLEALDSVERALRMQPEDEGLRAVLAQMEAILARQGVSRLGEAGERFDPERHEAVATRPADGVPDRTILEVARSGFTRGERVLRPAQVVVARAAEEAR